MKDSKQEPVATETNPADLSAAFFKSNIEAFQKEVRLLSSAEAKRLLKYLMEYPLQSKPVKLSSKREQSLFDMGTELTQAKLVMMIESMRSYQEKQNKVTESQGEQNDG